MTKRITIVIEDNLIKKLRERQAKMIKETSGSVSFSRVISEVLTDILK
ncbi:hypothetical protein [Nitrosopumilus sp. b3]|nr:hypothetical protein [Nitrosopumilus sp. b3]